MIEPTGEHTTDDDAPEVRPEAGKDPAPGPKTPGFVGRLFGGRGDNPPASPSAAQKSQPPGKVPPPDRQTPLSSSRMASSETTSDAPDVVEPRAYTPPDLVRDSGSRGAGQEPVAKELGQRVQTGFQDLSRLLGAI